jgi:hypothetical protein
MIRLMRMCRCLAAVLAIVIGLWAPLAQAGESIPRDFRLTAEYYPPLPSLAAESSPAREWHRWTTTVTASGRAVQETQRSPRGSVTGLRTRSVKLARRDVAKLVAAVRAANFHKLAGDYAFEVSRAPALVLRVAMDARYHEVTVYGPDRLKGDPEVAAFLRVWNQTLRLVPPPNPGQRPE